MRIGTGRLVLLIFTVALLVVRPVAAATVRHLGVGHDQGTYVVTFDVLLTAEAAITRSGPACPRRLKKLICSRPFRMGANV